jgi:imidazolonepropionase-like amidohydrolase
MQFVVSTRQKENTVLYFFPINANSDTIDAIRSITGFSEQTSRVLTRNAISMGTPVIIHAEGLDALRAAALLVGHGELFNEKEYQIGVF